MASRLLLVCLAALAALPGAAAAQLPAGPLTAKDAELVTNIAKHHDAAGGKLLDGYFYITTERDLTIYDVSKPEAPREVGYLLFGPEATGQYYFTGEDPDTNGKVLLLSNGATTQVVDVRDKSAPKLVGSVGDDAQHTISCILDCTWAYGSDGAVVDLRDPANPKEAGDWSAGKGVGGFHDVTEVAPGYVLTSSSPMLLLDVRSDPANPTVLARVAAGDNRLNHGNLWPDEMQDRIALVGGEASGPDCSEDAGAAFQTYDTTGWQETGTFTRLAEFRLPTGLYTEGRAPESTYCTHWFSTHPGYDDGGLVAISWYEQGTRLLRVSPQDGSITEVGHFLPIGTTASGAYWISDRILYVVDYIRGLDVVRYTGPLP